MVRLHKVLLDRERRVHEQHHGPIPPAELFRLVLHDEQFAWLRSLSTLIARIDEMVDGEDPSRSSTRARCSGKRIASSSRAAATAFPTSTETRFRILPRWSSPTPRSAACFERPLLPRPSPV